jgi:hypothetical protein
MAYDHKPGTFTLFKNDKKTADNHPDYRGPGKDEEGNEIEVAARLKDGNKGKFMSCSYKRKESRDAGASAQKPNSNKPISRDGEDDLPF